MKHTPGPWKRTSRNFEGAGTKLSICSDNDISLAHILVSNRTPKEEREANANLIVAAPDLLEVVQHFFTWHSEHFEDFNNETNMALLCLANEAEAAIAKAKGEV